MSASAEERKGCCATAYAGEAARWLLGERFHPGGARLTSRLIEALEVTPGAVVVDVACGRGTSTLQVAREAGCEAIGVDLSSESVLAAGSGAKRSGLAGRARFFEGDAEALPLGDGVADGAICECALCTFPNKRTAASEIARILRPGSRLALSGHARRARPSKRFRTGATEREAGSAGIGVAHCVGKTQHRIRRDVAPSPRRGYCDAGFRRWTRRTQLGQDDKQAGLGGASFPVGRSGRLRRWAGQLQAPTRRRSRPRLMPGRRKQKPRRGRRT